MDSYSLQEKAITLSRFPVILYCQDALVTWW